MLRFKALLITLFSCFIIGCGSTNNLKNSSDIDNTWQGNWQGNAIVENSMVPPRNLQIEIIFTSTHIRAFYSDEKSGIRRMPVRDLSLQDGRISFRVSYETVTTLRSIIEFEGERNGNNMMVEFVGREGGQSFTGKWQARHSVPEPEQIAVQ